MSQFLVNPSIDCSFNQTRMNLEKCILRIKVLRLFVIIGAFSTVAVFLIYSWPHNERDLTTNLSQGVSSFSSWPRASHAQKIKRANEHAVPEHQELQIFGKNNIKINIEQRDHVLRNKIKRLTSHKLQRDDSMLLVNATKNLTAHSLPNVHIFYSIPVDWSQQTTAFYPLLGMYAPDNRTVKHHFNNIRLLGANVLILTWSPSSHDQYLSHLFDEAHNFGLHITIEIDNYPNRTASSIFNDVRHFYDEFWTHPSFYKVYVTSKSNFMPMFYIRNVDCLAGAEWKKLLLPNGEISLRSSIHDAVFVGHISSRKDVSLIKTSNFNGFYSRMVSNGATYGATWKYWSDLKKTADKFKLIFVPTVGPGYDENSKLPIIASTRRHRTNGQYYGVAWRAAIAIGAELISTASYNDWLTGTQIEEAIPKSGFKDYSPGAPTKYIDLTRYWINEYISSWKTDTIKRIVDVKLCSSYFNNTVC